MKMAYEIFIRIFVYGLILFLFFSFLFFFLYSHPSRNISYINPSSYGFKYENIKLKTKDGILLDGWFIENKKSDRAIIAMHGYPMDKGNIFGMVSFLAKKYNLLLFDFRAMGKSEGFFTTGGKKELMDLDSAIEYLDKIGIKKIGVFGFSLGASVALLSENEKINAKVADAPFNNLKEELEYSFSNMGIFKKPLVFMMNIWGKIFTGIELNSIIVSDIVKKTKVPIIIFHGENDTVAPLWHSLNIKKENPEIELIIIKGADHGQVHFIGSSHYEEKIISFFYKNLK